MAKSAQRIEARRLRREQGLSIIDIARRLDVSKGSVSRWWRDIELTKGQLKKLLSRPNLYKLGQHIASRRNREEQIERKARFMKVGASKVVKLSKRELFLVGSALYWAEGAKKHRRTSFANSDPKMILIYLRWLMECLKISKDRIYCYVSINQDHEDRIEGVEKYWSKITGISRKSFNKASYKRIKNKKFYANFSNHYGALFVMVRKGANLNYEILGYIEGLKKNVS